MRLNEVCAHTSDGLSNLLGRSFRYGILDWGSTSCGVAGVKWVEKYLDICDKFGLPYKKCARNLSVYRFGRGSAPVIATWSVPWMWNKRVEYFELDSISGKLPLLLGKLFIKKFSIVERGKTDEVFLEKTDGSLCKLSSQLARGGLTALQLLPGEWAMLENTSFVNKLQKVHSLGADGDDDAREVVDSDASTSDAGSSDRELERQQDDTAGVRVLERARVLPHVAQQIRNSVRAVARRGVAPDRPRSRNRRAGHLLRHQRSIR